jgi:hypothetical protein
MKVRVNRQLTAGNYNVNFEVSDFTPEESAKMSSFGVPLIELRWMAQNGYTAGKIPLTHVNKAYNMFFNSAEAAKEYEKGVLSQIQKAMERLRESKDEFSSIDEVEL